MAIARKHTAAKLQALVLLASIAAALPARAQTTAEGNTYQVEAAFLFNFTRFIEWPSTAFGGGASPFDVCLWGADPFGSSLEGAVRGETVEGHRVEIRHVARALGTKVCQILFVGREEKNVRARLSELGPGVLSVSNRPGFLQEGGIIAFVVEGRHVRFDVNERAATKESLLISARLLNVARTVQR